MSIFHLVAIIAILLLGALFYLVLAEPGLAYRVNRAPYDIDSPEFVGLVASLVDVHVFRSSHVEVLSLGTDFYAAELAALRQARHSIHLEAFLFWPSPVANRFLEEMTQRARCGVRVRLVIDAIGSVITPNTYFTALREAGGEVVWYQPLRWYTLKRFNNRTHRELIVIDGKVGFIGGAGIADYWVAEHRPGIPWRDTMLKVTGNLVSGLQASFVENWLESTGEVLSSPEDFPYCRATLDPDAPPSTLGLVVNSSPSAGRSTRARILFQLLLASANERIQIQSPYFLPDASVCKELARAVARGVKVEIILPGKYNNHPIARRASRRRYGELLAAGVAIHEYQPGMNHAKVLIIDQVWAVLGSTNFDNRSFGLNDEVNIALVDRTIAARLNQDFECDLALSEQVMLDAWRRRSVWERVLAFLGIALERQQ
ncbi:phosphatidylserine/phosphatidylglycerophosphate/cardiolipin synthase family protein [Undibacterium sp.]|uniref:phospholipase D-like domain-containing protein n=1 Tax=Undibacterium sp. TaxID=1914977 RepID=UPI0025EE70D3|nr:phospholipase D-like domain-containing protein [Undibacterium sp.]